ncbi:GLPGLI family protein [Galbibacter sp.]|uniref:GLPGLI family protein n=1 Tax=Galbibacter sp. TaxID=2918471 RepID=UPI003A911492
MNEKYIESFTKAVESKKEVPMHIKQLVIQEYRNATPEDFELNFNNEESYYYLIPSLDEKGYNIGSNSDTSPYYTNNATHSLIYSSLTFGDVANKPLEWEITQETKKIGRYLCYKTTAVERLFSRQGFYYNRDAIAWFTPEIPISFGLHVIAVYPD